MRLDYSKFPKEGKALYDYLVENKKSLIATKKSLPVKSDGWSAPVSYLLPSGEETKSVKSEDNPNELTVTAIGNTAGWLDSHRDVIGATAYDKTIAERGPKGADMIYHLMDHGRTHEHEIGQMLDIYTKDFDPSYFNVKTDLKRITSCLFKSKMIREDNPKMFDKYKAGRIKQHSIGLIYVNLSLCINDTDYKEEFAEWEKRFPEVINKEDAEKLGHFWYSSEIKLLENSAVLWGANSLTNTYSVGKNIEPSDDTQDKEPSDDTLKRNFLLQITKI